MKPLLVIIVSIMILTVAFSFVNTEVNAQNPNHNNIQDLNQAIQSYTPNYNGTRAVNYAMMVHNDYLHQKQYPSGLNQSVMQKNLDYFNSEDCAHFVSEALIAGGLTYLAHNPPGDNLTNYLGGFPGSYGIVGVYRLADWLAGYDLPIFPANATEESIIGYQPIPASYAGSPHASIFYVTNYSMLPSYFLYPGDVVMDGGAGNGHAMLYIGNGDVVQTDPAAVWQYSPTVDNNITFYGMLSLNGLNVSAIYIHIPTFANKAVRITILSGSRNITGDLSSIKDGQQITLISSFPNGLGFGNYSYNWYINGNLEKTSESPIFTLNYESSINEISLRVSGSNGVVFKNLSVSHINNLSKLQFAIYIIPALLVIIIASFIILRSTKKNRKNK